MGSDSYVHSGEIRGEIVCSQLLPTCGGQRKIIKSTSRASVVLSFSFSFLSVTVLVLA